MLFELNFIDCNLSVTLYCLLVGYDLQKKKKKPRITADECSYMLCHSKIC